MQQIFLDALSLMITVLILLAFWYLMMRYIRTRHVITFVVPVGPDDLAAYQVAQVIEEARDITRQAAEGDADDAE